MKTKERKTYKVNKKEWWKMESKQQYKLTEAGKQYKQQYKPEKGKHKQKAASI